MSNSVYWLDGITKSEIVYNFCFELIKDIIEVFGGEDVFLKATDSFFPDAHPNSLPTLSKREEYLVTSIKDDEAVVNLFTNHKEAIYRAIEISTNEYGEEAVVIGVSSWFDIDESTCEKIPAIIENDTLEDHPELLRAVTRYVCIELLRQVSIFLEYGRI